MKRYLSLIVLMLLVSIFFAACAPQVGSPVVGQEKTDTTAIPTPAEPTTAPIVLTDGLQRPVTLDQPALRIVSLASSNTEILFAIGAGDQVVGRDDFSDFPAEVKDLPSVGGSMGNYNLEAITSLQPDLVLVAGINTPEQVKALEELNIKVFYLGNPTDLQEMVENLRIVGQLTGHEREALALADSLQARVKAVEDKLVGVEFRPKVFYELDASMDPSKPWTAGAGTFVDTIIKMAGGENVAAGMSEAWAQISQEELLVADPAIILLGDAAYGTTPDSVAQRPGWDVMRAVKENKIFAFDDNLVSRPGPRLVDGLETMAKILHPELFE